MLDKIFENNELCDNRDTISKGDFVTTFFNILIVCDINGIYEFVNHHTYVFTEDGLITSRTFEINGI